MHGKQWIMGTKESKAKYHNKAKDVDYNFAPELDDDVKISQKNLANAEKSLGTPWVIEEDPAYTPYFMKDGFKLVWASDKIINMDSLERTVSHHDKWKTNELHTDMIISIVNALLTEGIFKFKTNL